LAAKEIITAHIMNSNSITELSNLGEQLSEIAIINKTPEFLKEYLSLFEENAPKYGFIIDHSRMRRNIKNNKVLFEDRFITEERNADYKNRDKFFSDDHLYYQDENFKGFSAYSIVGDTFNESGFAPYAVAIHIVYFDIEDTVRVKILVVGTFTGAWCGLYAVPIHIVYFEKEDALRVKSFVSDSNDDIRDPANKYYEALHYLVNCPIVQKMESYALNEFRKHFKEGSYPGLGTVKKLTIMHHLELMSKHLDNENAK